MNLKEFLIKNSMDIQQFSIESGVPAPSLYKIISGDRKASLKNALKIEKATSNHVTVEELYGTEGG